MTSKTERVDRYHSAVRTLSDPASYVHTGGRDRRVLFGRGVGSSSYL
jgi:hypothetical protein